MNSLPAENPYAFHYCIQAENCRMSKLYLAVASLLGNGDKSLAKLGTV